MKTSQSYLDEIAKLRERHTLNAMAEKWDKNHTVRRKIANAWDAYHRAVERESKTIKPDEFNFYVLNENKEWVGRSRSMRGAYSIQKRLSKHGFYKVEEIPKDHPARNIKQSL